MELVWCRVSFAALKWLKSTQASGGGSSRRSLRSCNLVLGEAQTSPIDSPAPAHTVRNLNARPRRAHQHYEQYCYETSNNIVTSLDTFLLHVMLDCFFLNLWGENKLTIRSSSFPSCSYHSFIKCTVDVHRAWSVMPTLPETPKDRTRASTTNFTAAVVVCPRGDPPSLENSLENAMAIRLRPCTT